MLKNKYKTIKYSQREFKALSGLWKVERMILDAINFDDLAKKVVHVVLSELNYLKLGYQIIVLTLLSSNEKYVERIAISQTKAGKKALHETPIPFEQILVPFSARSNLLVRSIREKKVYFTHDLSDVLYPAGDRSIWQEIQRKCNIKTTMVYPIVTEEKAIGAMIFSLSKGINRISQHEKEVLAGFTNAVGLAVKHADLYRRLKRTNKHLKEVSDLKDEFVSLVSHELRTPMTAVGGTISTVLDGFAGKISRDTREFLQEAKNEVDRLVRMVNNLLNISRIESGRMKYQMNKFDIWPIVEMVFEHLQPLADEKGLKLIKPIQPKEKLMVKADQDKFEEILINLIGNSIKYTEQGSVSLEIAKEASRVKFAIKDTGVGINEADQKKLFRRFVRTQKGSRTAKGTGLGLYICKIMVESMKGKIWLKSELNKGSTFFFTLPLAK